MELKNFERILRETPPKVKRNIVRGISTSAKIYGFRRRVLHGKYKPKYRSPKTAAQGRAWFRSEFKDGTLVTHL